MGPWNDSPGHQPRMISEEYEDSDEDELHQAIPGPELTEEQTDKIYADLNAKKRRSLYCVLDTIPDHPKAKTKRICDTLECRDRLYILPSNEINIDGTTCCGSNIRNLVMDTLIEPRTPRSIQFNLLKQENKTWKWLSSYHWEALARAHTVFRDALNLKQSSMAL